MRRAALSNAVALRLRRAFPLLLLLDQALVMRMGHLAHVSAVDRANVVPEHLWRGIVGPARGGHHLHREQSAMAETTGDMVSANAARVLALHDGVAGARFGVIAELAGQA